MRKYIVQIAVVSLFLAVFNLQAKQSKAYEEEADKTLSPYFLVMSEGGETEKLPLKSTSADVKIAGVIADVKVTQVYKNEGKTTIEAIYVFPGSSKSAVYGMTMKIGDRILVAEIQKKEEARQTYEKAKREGRSASLLEQERPNVFQMSVANIMPGDLITVELFYTELLVPESGVYEFVYPTVVGPRYSNKKAENAKDEDKFVQSPYQHEGEKPLYNFDIKVKLSAGMPIDEILCNTHKVDINYDDAEKESAEIKLNASEKSGGNRDYILSYRLAGGQIQSGLLLSEGTENFFLLMLQPPKKAEDDAVPFRDYVFVVDVSGSMWGFPLDISKAMLKNLLGKLRPGDMFNVMLFAGGSEIMSCSSVPANKENIDMAVKLIESQQGGGGTELLPALKKVFNIPKTQGYSRSIVLLTDGYVDIEEEAFDLITKNLADANMFAFGIGSSVNRYLIEGIARCGMGQPFFITKKEQAEEQAEKFQRYIQTPVLTDIKLDFSGFNTYDVEPKSIPDVFQERPIIIFGKWRDNPDGKIAILGISGKTPIQTIVEVRKFATQDTSQALKYLWARHKIARLGDYNNIREDKQRIEEITNLGLKYNLLTKYTSFVAVDFLTRNKDTIHTVKQALPMPEGVSDRAMGGSGMAMASMPARTVNSFVGGVSDTEADALMPSSSPSPAKSMRNAPVKSITLNEETTLTISEKDPDDDFIDLENEPQVDINAIKKNLILPDIFRKGDFEGNVTLRVLVRKDGIVRKVVIMKSDSELLNNCVIQAVLKTEFTPPIRGKQPINSWLTIPIHINTNGVPSIITIVEAKIKKQPYISLITPKETRRGTWITSDGVEFREIRTGDGKMIEDGKKVTIHLKTYTDNCTLESDTYKDNKPITFTIGGANDLDFELEEGLTNMKVGGKRVIFVRADWQKTSKYYEVELLKVE